MRLVAFFINSVVLLLMAAPAYGQPSTEQEMKARIKKLEDENKSLKDELAKLKATGPIVEMTAGNSLTVKASSGKILKAVTAEKPDVIHLDPSQTDPHDVVVTALKPGEVKIVLTDKDGAKEIKTIRVEKDLSEVRAALAKRYPELKVVLTPATEAKVIAQGTVETDEMKQELERFIEAFVGDGNVVNIIRSAKTQSPDSKVGK